MAAPAEEITPLSPSSKQKNNRRGSSFIATPTSNSALYLKKRKQQIDSKSGLLPKESPWTPSQPDKTTTPQQSSSITPMTMQSPHSMGTSVCNKS